jgi:pyruvate,orthophosphate dikinase
MPDVYFFGNGKADGNARMKNILGGKGANLAEMTSIGIPVPPGFTISAALCGRYLADRKLPSSLNDEVEQAMARLQEVTGRRFGDSSRFGPAPRSPCRG